MTKKELAQQIATEMGITQDLASDVINAGIEKILQALGKGEKIELSGFGIISVNMRAERTGRNPSTGETIMIPAKKVPVFKPSKAMKEAVQ